jgi:hypothetical protein
MFDRLLHLWVAGRLTDDGLDRAVVRGWITDQQADVIRSAER